MNITRTFDVLAPIERVGAALCSEAFNVEADREREEVLECRYTVIEQDESHLSFELRSEEYKRTKLGRIDRSGTVQVINRFRWDQEKEALSWSYHGAGSKWVRVSGIYKLSRMDGGTHVEHEIAIHVNVPVFGSMIAKFISGEFDNATARFQRLLTKHATS